MAPEMGHTLLRLGFKMMGRPEGDRMSAKSQDFGKNRDHPMGLQMALFCYLIAAKGCLNFG